MGSMNNMAVKFHNDGTLCADIQLCEREHFSHEQQGPMQIQGPNVTASRDPGLVRAELVDALRDYAAIFREKAQFENYRADAVDAMAETIENGGKASGPDIAQSQDFERKYQLLEMRHAEVKMKCNRLIMEHRE